MARVAPLLGAALALMSAAAGAHLLQVFAWAEGDRIHGTVRLAGGSAAGSARVTVRGPDGETLAEVAPDAQGAFTYRARRPVDHRLVARTADGHRAEWTVTAAELGAQRPAATGPEAAESRDPETAALAAMVEAAVARQVGPLRDELRAHAEGARLADLVGGLGIIFGIAGVVLWWRSRRRAP